MSPQFFIEFLFFHPMIALKKLWEIFFISSKKLFSFSRFSNFRHFPPSFPPSSKFRRTNGSGIIYDVMNWLEYTPWIFMNIYNYEYFFPFIKLKRLHIVTQPSFSANSFWASRIQEAILKVSETENSKESS